MDRKMAIISRHYSGAFTNERQWPFVVTLRDEGGNIFQAQLEIISLERCDGFKIAGELSLRSINVEAILKAENAKDVKNLKSSLAKGSFEGWYDCKERCGNITVIISDLEI